MLQQIKRNKLLLPLLSLLLSVQAQAAFQNNSKEPLLIEADTVTYNDKTGVTTYIGKVIATQGEMRIEADELTATLNEKKEVTNAQATGKPAKFQQRPQPDKGLVKGQGNIITYDNVSGIATLTGKAFVTQDGARFSGEKIIYDMPNAAILATGSSNRRVQILIPPNMTKQKK